MGVGEPALGEPALGCRGYAGVPANIRDAPPSESGCPPSGFIEECRRPGCHCLHFRLPRPKEPSGLWIPLKLEWDRGLEFPGLELAGSFRSTFLRWRHLIWVA